MVLRCSQSAIARDNPPFVAWQWQGLPTLPKQAKQFRHVEATKPQSERNTTTGTCPIIPQRAKLGCTRVVLGHWVMMGHWVLKLDLVQLGKLGHWIKLGH